MIERVPIKSLFKYPQPGFGAYAGAYSEAAKYLKEALAAAKVDSVLRLPCVFLYRHAIEVAIKAVLIEHGERFGISKKTVVERGHNLLAQVNDLSVMADDAGLPLSQEFLSNLAELQKFDPGSFHSRYPEDKDGKRLLTDEAASISLETLGDGAETLLDDIMWIGMEFDQQLLREELGEEYYSRE